MKITTKQVLIISIVVIVILVIVGFWFYKKGKKTVTIQAPPADNPTGTGAENNPAGVSQAEITALANELHSEMEGFNWSGHDVTPYQKFNSLSDTDFVDVYNTFNTFFQATSSETLRGWIESESFAFDDTIQSILLKMNRLNLI